MATLRLRRIGNSVGTTFSQDLLHEAGLNGDELLEVSVRDGELRLRRVDAVVVALTRTEAELLAAAASDTPEVAAILRKVQKALKA